MIKPTHQWTEVVTIYVWICLEGAPVRLAGLRDAEGSFRTGGAHYRRSSGCSIGARKRPCSMQSMVKTR